MSNIKAALRQYIKYSHIYQNYRARGYFERELSHVDHPIRKRVCYMGRDKARQIAGMLATVRIEISPRDRFQCWIDEGLFTFKSETMVDNIPPNYRIIVDHSIEDLVERFSKEGDNAVARGSVIVLRAVCDYIDRIVEALEACAEKAPENRENLGRIAGIYRNMKHAPASTLEDALQRILLWQSIFWQSHHRLVGLGRLDKLLGRFVRDGEPITEGLLDILRDFYDALHKYYDFKSNRISKGDTGQIIIVGGLEPDGSYFCNQLTYAFIKAFIGHRLPDPKVLLRVCVGMPEDLLALAVECIATGIGCPLLSNDDRVISSLEAFGYTSEDAYNYVTSACWEPLAYGKSLEKNNLADINYGMVIVEMYRDERFETCGTFDDVLALFLEKTKAEIQGKLRAISAIRWERDPVMSMFTEQCLASGKDVSEGGAVYSDYGLLSAGMANAVNSLLNLKRLVFADRKADLAGIRRAAMENFAHSELKTLLERDKYYGRDDDAVIELTRRIVEFTSDECRGYRNFLGGKVKFGLSTSNYMEEGKLTGATLDGRCGGEALGVHITNPKGVSFTELVGFATHLDYSGNRSNGNVLDFFVSPALINDSRDKFILFLKRAISAGFFQMQINVVSSETLIAAKRYPDKYPDLIVRVWGFSAYFVDLPENYQDVLISRALESEGKSKEVY